MTAHSRLSISHIHIDTRAHTYPNTDTHKHAHTHTHMCAHTYTHNNTHLLWSPYAVEPIASPLVCPFPCPFDFKDIAATSSSAYPGISGAILRVGGVSGFVGWCEAPSLVN